MHNPRNHVQHYEPLPTRRSLRHRARRLARMAWLSFCVWEMETYLQRCERDHVIAGDDALGFRLHLQELRCALAIARAS